MTNDSNLIDEKWFNIYFEITSRSLLENKISTVNPNGMFFFGFTDSHIDELTDCVVEIMNRFGRTCEVVECKDKTLKEIMSEASGAAGNLHAVWQYTEERLIKENFALVLTRFSQSRLPRQRRIDAARGILKIIDDAHFDANHPMADVIFVDFASFLESGWNEIAPYIYRVGYIDKSFSFGSELPRLLGV